MAIMVIAIPKETAPDETRVAATPETVKRLVKEGFDVRVQKSAGAASFARDEDYTAAGAKLSATPADLYKSADVVFKVQPPDDKEIPLLKEGTILIALLQPLTRPDLVRALNARRLSALSLDMVPRIARAQKLDALSSQSSIAGYKAVLMAADTLGKIMPMMMTAAGTVTAARVFVIGAGVAGLQAIATARRLGAVVEAYDTRPVVKEQVESLGGKFLQLDLGTEEAEDKRGYARELSAEAKQRAADLVAQAVKNADIVITTALIPGKPAPRLITADMVKAMKNGSVIVDLAADGGGNCELSKPGETVQTGGVTIIARRNVPGLMAEQASQLYARNILNLFMEIQKKGQVQWDLENEVVKGSLITHEGRVVNEMVQKAAGVS